MNTVNAVFDGLMYPRPPIIDFAYGILGLIIFVGVIVVSIVAAWSIWIPLADLLF